MKRSVFHVPVLMAEAVAAEALEVALLVVLKVLWLLVACSMMERVEYGDRYFAPLALGPVC